MRITTGGGGKPRALILSCKALIEGANSEGRFLSISRICCLKRQLGFRFLLEEGISVTHDGLKGGMYFSPLEHV
jgi:hypothetical protein